MIGSTRRLLLASGAAAGMIVAVPSGVEAEVTRHVLTNGARVIVRKSRAAQVVAISLQVDAAVRPETEETAGMTNFLHRAMLRGTSRRSAAQVAEAADELGGAVDASADAD